MPDLKGIKPQAIAQFKRDLFKSEDEQTSKKDQEKPFSLADHSVSITRFFVGSIVLKMMATYLMASTLVMYPHFQSNLSSVSMAKEALYSISRKDGQLQSSDPNSVS
mmetsp:Transcript_40656/g.61989  ORF Transcript_40656/g.61989 Transcript_40656/m.61989 type:complete len:107 (+) Transcript_40656:3-323(+)